MKKKILSAVVAVAIIGGLIGATVLSAPQSTGADTSPITTEVDNQQKELSNHEARITNNESNIKDLQTNTNTPPSPTQVSVPASPPPAPITITSYLQIPVDNQGVDCQLTYSDGTTYQWHWQVYNPGSSGVTTYNTCDQFLVGQPKI